MLSETELAVARGCNSVVIITSCQTTKVQKHWEADGGCEAVKWLEWLAFTINIPVVVSMPGFAKSKSFYTWKLFTRVGNLFSFSSALSDFSDSAVVIHLLCTGNTAPLCCYINLKTSLACPMTPTTGDRQTIFPGELTNSSVINTRAVSWFNLRAKKLALKKYLLFLSLCHLCSWLLPQAQTWSFLLYVHDDNKTEL